MKIDFSALEQLGFSRLEIACYSSLEETGSVIASKLASAVGARPSNLYPILRRLEERGFVSSLKTDWGPTYYSSIDVEDALDDFFAYQKEAVLEIIRQQRKQFPPR